MKLILYHKLTDVETNYLASQCIAFMFTFWSSAAQKARDDFDVAEKALREVDDNIRYISDCDASTVVDRSACY